MVEDFVEPLLRTIGAAVSASLAGGAAGLEADAVLVAGEEAEGLELTAGASVPAFLELSITGSKVGWESAGCDCGRVCEPDDDADVAEADAG